MQLRSYRTVKNGRTYEYHRLVESYRREDGKPAHRILAKLPALSALQVANLKASLEANRRGAVVTVAQREGTTSVGPAASACCRTEVLANLRYLDVAVLVALWRQLGFGGLLGELFPADGADVPAEDVVAALTVQRCIAPGSKLLAERWMPRTALPELLGMQLGKFNNTRIHRVLEALDAVTPRLMRNIARQQAEIGGAFSALFLDVSDARFVGHGPSYAEKAKCKEGMYARKIGIVLLCSEDGMPLRWAVVPGRQNDSKAMGRVLKDLEGLSWTREVPVVCDRAMGKTEHVRTMLSHDLRFLTAMTVPEFGTYAPALPHQAFAALSLSLKDNTFAKDTATVVDTATRNGFEPVSRTLFVLDQGVLDPPAAPSAPDEMSPGEPKQDKTVIAMANGRAVMALRESGEATNNRSAGRALGLTINQAAHAARLVSLNRDIQEDVLAGKAIGLSLSDLKRVARMDSVKQNEEFDRLIREVAPLRDPRRSRRTKSSAQYAAKTAPPRVRVLAALNPELLVQQRRNLVQLDEQLQAFVKELNGSLAKPASRRSRERVAAAVEERLRTLEVRDMYTVQVRDVTKQNGTPGFQAALTRKEDVWMRRNRYAGFTILAAHPNVEQTSAKLAQLYRAKDQVEKDFQIIKSLVRLRPVWHYTDPKVRAHVTVCVLALALERAMAQRLREAANSASPAGALEILGTCHLNRISLQAKDPFYQITTPDRQQRDLVRDLGMEHLLDEREMAEQIQPR